MKTMCTILARTAEVALVVAGAAIMIHAATVLL